MSEWMIHQEMIKHVPKEMENPLLKEKKAMALATMQGEKRSFFYCKCANGPQTFKQIEFWH